MRSKLYLLSFIAVCGLAACGGDRHHKFNVIGTIAGMPQQSVLLEELSANDVITVVDSAKSTAAGGFELSGVAPDPGLYRLHFNQNKYILLSIENGNLKVTGDWNTLENYNVIGSNGSASLRSFLTAVRSHLRDFNSMSVVLDTMQARGNDSMVKVAKSDFQDMRVKFTQFVEHYADTTKFEPNAIFAARILNPGTEQVFLTTFSQSLDKRFPSNQMTHDFQDYFTKMTTPATQPTRGGVSDGTVAPDINLPTPDGKRIALSSLKGKYVLLDFWASWCQPCRMENPNVVAAFNKFKGKNFAIYSVSLDSKKEAWEKAIAADNLTWTHVSDLKGWESTAAAMYGVQSIPANFLIDPNGKIIARDLRGSSLEDKLNEVLK